MEKKNNKPILVLGSSVVDIIINIDRLPVTAEDIHIKSQSMAIGGCAHNVACTIKSLEAPVVFLTPVGTGIYGDFVARELKAEGLSSNVLHAREANGCCYCMVEAGGERTFVVDHGAEYLFREEWLRDIDPNAYSAIYICGLEIEEKTGSIILDWLQQNREADIFFAPGPRISLIDKDKMDRLLKLKPIVHLNRQEIKEFTGEKELEKAALALYEITGNSLIITAGREGAYIQENGQLTFVPGEKVEKVVDTIGAGDGHIGAIMAELSKGKTLREATSEANKIAAKIVQTKGAKYGK